MQSYTGYVTAAMEQLEKSTLVVLYNTHKDAEKAICQLRKAGFNMKKVSIVGMDSANRMQAWGKSGVFWGGLWGLLLGSAVFHIPGIGPLLVAGPVVAWIVRALEDEAALGRMNALAASLYNIGVPKGSIIEYENQIKAGKFIIIAHGLLDEVNSYKVTLATTNHANVREHSVRM